MGAANASLPAFAISVVRSQTLCRPSVARRRPPRRLDRLTASNTEAIGSGWAGADVLDHQQAVVGELQYIDRTPERHAGRSQRGQHLEFVISVTDGAASRSLRRSRSPWLQTMGLRRISGTPATSVTVWPGRTPFTPTASDPDGQALTFSITNKPSWASFSTSTGRPERHASRSQRRVSTSNNR